MDGKTGNLGCLFFTQQQHKAKRRKLYGAKLTKLFQTFSIMKIKQFAREVFKLGIRGHFVLPQPPNHKVAFREIIQPSKGNAKKDGKEANDFTSRNFRNDHNLIKS